MGNILSTHYIPTHGRPEDIEYFRELSPNVMKFVDADAHRVQEVQDVLPTDTLFFLRDWALSEQKEDMQREPEKTGQRHADEWANRINGQYGFLPRERIIVSGINEPAVWVDFTVVPYTVAFLDRLREHGLAGAALNLSVGWPANNGPDQPPDWSPFAPVQDAIVRGRHYLCLHEYWDERGPYYNWGWWCGRYEKCPWNVPIIIGECGVDKYVSDPAVDPARRGWQGWMDGQQYSNQVGEYIASALLDHRIMGLCVYTTDFGHPWDSFDTAPAHKYLVDHYVSVPAPQWGSAGVPEPEPEPVPPVTAQPLPVEPMTGAAYAPPLGGHVISQHFYQIHNGVTHTGTDFEADIGTPVIATADGVVAYVGMDNEYGWYVRIWHPYYAFHSFYAHLSATAVSAGQQVVRGQPIGNTGDTGNTTGPHLHYEIRLGDEQGYAPYTPMPQGCVDPETFFAMVGQKL